MMVQGEFPDALDREVPGRVEALDACQARLDRFTLGLDPGMVAVDGGAEFLQRLDVPVFILVFHRHRRR